MRNRFFNGIVRRMEAIGLVQRDRWKYRIEVVPRPVVPRSDDRLRIFQQKTAVEIVQTLLSENQITRSSSASRRPAVREYTTQYNETDLTFIHRLLQESGYFYYFGAQQDRSCPDRDGPQPVLQARAHPIHWVIHEGNNVDVFDRWSEALQTAYGEVKLQDTTRPSQHAGIGPAGRRPFDGRRGQARRVQLAGDDGREPDRGGPRPASASKHRKRRPSLHAGHGYVSEFCPGVGSRWARTRSPRRRASITRCTA
ncbi:MAG: contractile injection system protein, VgrG/Pvc8 family [Aliidongia sp.]